MIEIQSGRSAMLCAPDAISVASIKATTQRLTQRRVIDLMRHAAPCCRCC
jgi:hypothetical protein